VQGRPNGQIRWEQVEANVLSFESSSLHELFHCASRSCPLTDTGYVKLRGTHCDPLNIVKLFSLNFFFSSVYEWSQVLPVESSLKQAVDWVLCAICHIRNEYFSQILQWIGVITDATPDYLTTESGQSATDDIKDSQQNQPLTDDVKADSGAAGSRRTMSMHSYLCSFNVNSLNESQLSTLSTSSQSPVALRRLIDCGVVSALCAGLYMASQRKLYNVFDMEPLNAVSENFVSTDAAKIWVDLNASGPSNSHQQSANSSGRSSPLSHSG
jgi:Baculoviral IAP repeat-containing protein 6